MANPRGDDRMDFTVLNPRMDPARFERMVSVVMERTDAPVRRSEPAVAALIASALRPALAAAAVLVLFAGATSAWHARSTPPSPPSAALAGMAGLPEPVAAWAAGLREPRAADLPRLARHYAVGARP